ncbi:hypothetical protein ACIBU0_40610 [Streptomyces sp. NPDC049627]|uniref:VMAP-C domain-containing protein n=1 Tax=Streptomyces sp. NPDC049627 TaxID=3365595 RepID=UPI0037B268B6
MFARPARFGGRMAHRAALWRTDRQLLEFLLDVERLHQRENRHELLRLMGDFLDLGRPFEVPESSDTRTHLRAVVRAARERPGALGALGEVVHEMEPDDIAAAWFRLMITVLTASNGPLPADLMLDIITEARNQPGDFEAARSRYVAQRHSTPRPLNGTSLPQVLLQLYDARVPAADPAAPRRELLRFLRLLTEEPMKPGLARLLASVLGPDPEGLRASGPETAPADGERQIIIQIRVEEEGPPTDLPPAHRHYSLRGHYYERLGDNRPVHRGSQSLPDLFTGEELAARGRAFLAGWQEPTQMARGVSKRVEFLLPHSLLGHPAETWPGGVADVPISHTCQVVVRSLTRYKDSSVHDEWLHRWNALDRDCSPGDALDRIAWMGPGTPGGTTYAENPAAPPCSWPAGKYPSLRLTDPADVADWLEKHRDLSCLGLAAPYDHDDALIRDAVRDALLLDGVPVMVWRRDAADPEGLLEALRNGQPPALLAELPHSVHHVRKRGGRRRAHGVHDQITLLWDDPTCVFSGQDQQMTGTRGADGGAA